MLNFLTPFVENYPYPVSESLINFRIYLYGLLIFILFFLTYSFIVKSKREEEINGIRNPLTKSYLAAYCGILFISLNVFISSFSLFLSDGRLILFGAYKAVLYNLGTLILIIGLVNSSLSIIYFNDFLRNVLKISYYFAILLATLGQVIVILEAFGVSHGFLSSKLPLILATGGLLYLFVLGTSCLGLIQQLRYNASPIERLRIQLLVFTFIIQIVQILARVVALVVASNPELFNLFSFIIYPLIDFIGYPISMIFLLMSIYTPNWLQIKMNIIPKEYANLI